ncbi:hypothetical protein [Cryptosporangium phraense]|uniref:Uncharacterized protein n=1 Tax=Cryptosporangium phraense TaxID=2593070 RepID=A0A545AJA9_9ACTN|nr:hypothetical protein [Cryptosporangium phraense]TQS41412.1 hypothetical protein FL583_29330 [Cryptosporangium phraense]
MGRHANGDTPTGILFTKPEDPKFRRAAGGRKTGKIPRIAPSADTGFLPAQTTGSIPTGNIPAASTAVIPAQRREPAMAGSVAAPAPRAAVRVSMAPPIPRSGPPMTGPRSAPMEPPTVRVPSSPSPSSPSSPSSLSKVQLSLPMWTKVCLVLGAVLLVVGFGGLAASYAVGQHADPSSAGSELIRR